MPARQQEPHAQLKPDDAVSPEPAPTIPQEPVESATPAPAPLAFAARMAAVPQADQVNPAQPLAKPVPQTPARIPTRHAATAQILPGAPLKPADPFKADAFKRDAAPDDLAPRPEGRTDFVLPRLESIRDAAPGSTPSAPPQQAAPAAREVRIIETPAEPAAAPSSSARDFSVRVPDNRGGSTQVRFVESGGEVRVSVRTSDEGLAQNLRSHLSDLSQRLADGGIPAEIWKPSPEAASSQNHQHQPDRDGRGSNGQPSGGQDGQPDRQQKRPAWLEEMDASLHAEA